MHKFEDIKKMLDKRPKTAIIDDPIVLCSSNIQSSLKASIRYYMDEMNKIKEATQDTHKIVNIEGKLENSEWVLKLIDKVFPDE